MSKDSTSSKKASVTSKSSKTSKKSVPPDPDPLPEDPSPDPPLPDDFDPLPKPKKSDDVLSAKGSLKSEKSHRTKSFDSLRSITSAKASPPKTEEFDPKSHKKPTAVVFHEFND
ncbi:unnamed protein product, partial [Nesidiocoris tenuis]